ncbi:MAG: insulinase family protein [Bacteroidota bacterium]|nr:insulinase family protein [Bacteroidota bacterium]
MNRSIAPDIKPIQTIHTGFVDAQQNIYRIHSEEGVFKLEINFPKAGFGFADNKFHALYALDLLMSGTAQKSAHTIADEIDLLGGFVFKNCDYYSSSIAIYGLNENLEAIVSLVKNAMDECVFDEKELEVFKSKKTSELRINLNKTSFLAGRSINHLLLGKQHPFSRSSDEEIIQSIQRKDLLDFKEKNLINPCFIYTGPTSYDIKQTLVNIGFELENISPINYQESISEPEETFEIIPKENSTQNAIRLGKILPDRKHKDYFVISLTYLILGGYFGSRLMKNIREDKGLTYGIHSSITPFRTFSLFKISSECNNQLTQEVKSEIEKEIIRLQTELVEENELQTAKNYLIGALLRSFDGAFNISERLKTNIDLGGEKDFYERYFEAINQISAEDIMNCANNFFDFKTFKYSIAGEV